MIKALLTLVAFTSWTTAASPDGGTAATPAAPATRSMRHAPNEMAIGSVRRPHADAAPRTASRPLGRAGVVCLVMTVLGALAMGISGVALLATRASGRDVAYWALCAFGCVLLQLAAFGLMYLTGR